MEQLRQSDALLGKCRFGYIRSFDEPAASEAKVYIRKYLPVPLLPSQSANDPALPVSGPLVIFHPLLVQQPEKPSGIFSASKCE